MYQIGKYQAIMAYVDTGLKIASIYDRLSIKMSRYLEETDIRDG